MRFSRLPGNQHRASSHLGPARWLGTPFALASLMPLSGAFGLVEVQMEGGGEASPLFLAVFAMPFLCIGLGLLLWRRECLVDLCARTITKETRVLVTLSRASRGLNAFAAATFEKTVVTGTKSRRTVFPVALETPEGSAFTLFHCRNKQTARQTAEWLAHLARLPVIDRVDGGGRLRACED